MVAVGVQLLQWGGGIQCVCWGGGRWTLFCSHCRLSFLLPSHSHVAGEAEMESDDDDDYDDDCKKSSMDEVRDSSWFPSLLP